MLGLFAASILVPDALPSTLVDIGLVSAGIAALTLIVAIISYFRVPKHLSVGTFIVYGLLALTVASIVLVSGDSTSPLIGLWIGVSVFAGIFGWRGFALILVMVLAYDAYSYILNATPESIVIATVASVAPLIASFIIWHSKSGKDIERDKAYDELATELSHEANKSDTVIGAINDGVVSIDRQGIIQLINPAAQRIIGWAKSDAVGLSYKSVIKLNDTSDKPVNDLDDPVAKVLTTNHEVHSEDFSVTTEGGKKILLSLIVSPIGHPSTGAIMVFRDMTNERAEERQQAEFISTASHEMRTPVASIEGYLGLALNPATATIDDKARDYIQKAHESAQHLGRLFQDLLDVSKAEDGRMTNNPSVVDIIEFVGDVVEGLAPRATEKGLRFIYKPSIGSSVGGRTMAPVYFTHVDNDHLREVVANLAENAIKYTREGDVIIDVSGDETHVTISVQDSGIGIPAEDIPHLFQKFYRVDNSDTREIGGTGLGLYLSRRLAEMMGGQIRVQSEYKKGSTFYLDLPRIDHLEAERLIDASAAAEELKQQSELHQPISRPDTMLSVSTMPVPNTPPPQLPPQANNVTPATPPAVPTTSPQPQTQPIAPTDGSRSIQIPVRGTEKI